MCFKYITNRRHIGLKISLCGEDYAGPWSISRILLKVRHYHVSVQKKMHTIFESCIKLHVSVFLLYAFSTSKNKVRYLKLNFVILADM